jgi:high-affinity iron transporter
VYAGAALAVVGSILAAAAFEALAGGFEANEPLFEGITLIVACALVTWLLLWMFSQKNIAKELEQGVKSSLSSPHKAGLAAFAFISVFREGVEVVLFLGGIALSTGALSIISMVAGATLAIIFAWALFRHLVKLDLQSFFIWTSAVLVLLAAGLLSQGVHELQEIGALPTSIEHVYDITPAQNADGSYPLMHEKGAGGSLLKGLIGYDTSPSLEQLFAYFGYLAFVYAAYLKIGRN